MRLRLRVAAVALTCLSFYLLYSSWHSFNSITWDEQVPPATPADVNLPADTDYTSDRIRPPKILSEVPKPVKPAASISGEDTQISFTQSPQASKLSDILPSSERLEVTLPQHEPSNEIPLSPEYSDSSNAGTASPSLSASPSPSPTPKEECVGYMQLQRSHQGPLSEGKRKFPYSRPSPGCRTFQLPAMEKLIEQMKGVIKDPDLFRLFENAYPNTLDTMIKWRGYAKATDPLTGDKTETDEEIAYVITGDIDAMWLRDSASQIYSYLPLLEESSDPDSLASLWRGVINSHARYIIISPYCHSFQPPPESGVPPSRNDAYSQNHPNPPYDPVKVFDCKWELDSLASFLQISSAYYERTGDLTFFQKYQWIEAVAAAVKAAGAMRKGTYAPNGRVQSSAWTFTGWTSRGTETLSNDGIGNPTKENGMVRTAFRPSDDACIYQLLVPANMMWAKYLEDASLIMSRLSGDLAQNLTTEMQDFAFGIRLAIDRDAVTPHPSFGDIYAYEIDGYGGTNLMDDANIPSLLAIPLWNYTQSAFRMPSPDIDDVPKRDYEAIYRNTRRFVLNESNPYFMQGPVLSAVGGPHIGPGRSWPMAAIVRALTAIITGEGTGVASDLETKAGLSTDEEVLGEVRAVLDSTTGSGVVHESVDAWNENLWTRPWFGWANGLLGELVIRMAEEDRRVGREGKEAWLGKIWQEEG